MKKKLALDKTQISKLTNLNVIVGGTGTLEDSDTNPLDTGDTLPTSEDPQGSPTTGGTIPTQPFGSGINCTKPPTPITTSKLC